MINHVAALALVLERHPVPSEQIVSGSPETGMIELGRFGESRYGVWEMTPGAMSDVEADELFVVLAGAARVLFVASGETVTLAPGSTMRLNAGTQTIWTVTETLRKLYLT